ncbi:MAG: IS200/IS605 family transposase [Ruminococcaceae bacterium]|nr:IS200/IS605 family transposase [Oscillospiraceae bacterium]
MNHGDGVLSINRYYIVFCTKYRRRVLQEEISETLEAIIRLISEQEGIVVDHLSIAPDFVAIEMRLDAKTPLHQTIKKLKDLSSGMLRKEYPELKSRLPSLWTRSYFCCTLGSISDEIINEYLQKQYDT